MNFFGVGLPEMMLILVVALLVFGPRKLPEIGKTLAKTLKGLQDASKEFESALNREAEELERANRAAESPPATEDLASEPTYPTIEELAASEAEPSEPAMTDTDPAEPEIVAAADQTDAIKEVALDPDPVESV